MALAHDIVLYFHLIGWAILLGGTIIQLRDKAPFVNAAMVNGALLQLATGIILVVLVELGPDPVNQLKLGAQAGLTLILSVLVFLNRRFYSISRGLWLLMLLLSFAIPAMALFW